MIRTQLTAALAAALTSMGIDAPDDIPLERPANPDHGDWSSAVALSLAKPLGRNPRELGTEIADTLRDAPPAHVTSIDIAGPGFVNFTVGPTWLHDVLREVIDQGEDGYATPDVGAGARVNIEFVSANPTGPLHAGGGRWAAYGDALASVMQRCGYVVEREFLLNDRGVQMGLFAASLAARRDGTELPEDGYAGQYIHDWAAEMPADADPSEWGYAKVKRHLADVLGAMGVHYDTWYSEQANYDTGAFDHALAALDGRGVTFEADGAVWLRSTDFGDDKDRVLRRSNGEPTYLLGDVAYHHDKYERGFDLLIDIWGADHHGYVARLAAACEALGRSPDTLEIILGQLVTLRRGGAEVRLSKRSGDIVELADLLDEIGPDAARLTFLLQSLDSRQTIDLDVVTSRASENPVFYVQYASARIHSMMRRAAAEGVVRRPLDEVELALLTHERELEVLRHLYELPAIMRLACVERAPHKITQWVRELATAFHGFYHDCKVIGDEVDPELTQARLWLVESARIGVVIALGVLGVSAPESM